DLASPESVRAFTAAWRGPLHAVVANAGVMALPSRTVTAYGWELQLATNFLGHFALITGLREALREAGDARIVMGSSGAQLGSPRPYEAPLSERRRYDPCPAYPK